MIRARRRMVEKPVSETGAQLHGTALADSAAWRSKSHNDATWIARSAISPPRLLRRSKTFRWKSFFRRIDTIFEMYGPNTDIQVTGGDPTSASTRRTCRCHPGGSEIGECARHCSQNGIRASRSLLKELAEAGLVDVAFPRRHDTTNERDSPQRVELKSNQGGNTSGALEGSGFP